MKQKQGHRKRFIISLGISAAVLAAGMVTTDTVTFSGITATLFFPLARLMGFIAVGLAAGQIIEAAGWTEKLAVVAGPLFRISNLGNRCSAAFTTAFVSGTAANAMLFDYYQEEKISRMQLFLTNYVNQLPAFFLHLPTTFFIVIPLTGAAGMLYFALTFAATLLRTLCFLLFGSLYPGFKTAAEPERSEQTSPGKSRKNRGLLESIKTKLPARITRIAVFVLPIYTLVFVLNANGVFDLLNRALSNYLTISFMPVESLSVVMLSFASEFTSGFAAAGALMDAGVLTTKQTVIALLVGNITAFPIRALRHQIPRYMGIFTPGMGLQLLLSGQFFRISSLVLVGMVYYLAG
ncbi:MAG: nucleoside recognition protein [Desulfobacteraceae bacterium]